MLRAWLIIVLSLGGSACSAPPPRVDSRVGSVAADAVTVFVVKRSWHIDLGFVASDLHPPLAALRAGLPQARYLLFGFGDRHYLLAHGGSSSRLSGSLLPGAGLVLLTGLAQSPQSAFGAANVVRLPLSPMQARQLESFVWSTLVSAGGEVHALAAGPYADSFYFAAAPRYSLLHTCNTWAAEGLQAAGLPVSSRGVELAGQLWRQVQRLQR